MSLDWKFAVCCIIKERNFVTLVAQDLIDIFAGSFPPFFVLFSLWSLRYSTLYAQDGAFFLRYRNFARRGKGRGILTAYTRCAFACETLDSRATTRASLRCRNIHECRQRVREKRERDKYVLSALREQHEALVVQFTQSRSHDRSRLHVPERQDE